MFIGHFGVGFAARRLTPRVPLVILFAAAQLADLLWPVLVGLGIEHVRIDPGNTAVTPLDFVSYPYSHSLATLFLWGVVLGAVYTQSLRDRGVHFVLAALVVSPWLLDFVTHRPDMPLYPGGAKVGLGLWNSLPATVIVEVTMYAAGLRIYARATRACDGIGRWAFAAFALFLLMAYAANLVGPPPPSVTAIWIGAISGSAILLAWIAWFDRHHDHHV